MGLRNGSFVCDHCSSTIFAPKSFQIAWAAKDSSDPHAGFSYTTQTWQEIDDGENKGCNWCDILWGEIPVWYQHRKKKEYPMPEETHKITVQFEKLNSKEDIFLRVMVEDDWRATYHVQCDAGNNAAAFIPGRKLMWQVASPRAFKLASDCLAQCTLHRHCLKAQETTLPTRLLDCSDPERPRLVLTKGLRSLYAALSYVWGEPQPHSTCTTKLSSYLESIDVLLLPQTIKDAIICTHNLNLRYLWADSLCILQDSDEDKQREIPQMCDIYRDAYVTIIAASSQKVSEGFLRDRKRLVETLLPFWCPDGRLGTISVDNTTSARPSKEPVNQRAWCFQERILSARTLVYASHTLQYQCQAAMCDMGSIWHYLPSSQLGELRLPDMMMSRMPCSTPSHDDISVLLTAWQVVLGDYTQRAVSDPSDRLVAISGIAQLFQRWWGNSNRYIAGLWERNLSTDILWYRHSPSDGRLVTQQYLAPSWSWAATIGHITAGSTKSIGKIVWDVQLCEAIPVSDNHPLGQVKDGKLVVRAIVKDVIWAHAEPELFEFKQQPCIPVVKIGDDLRNDSDLEVTPAPDIVVVDTTIGVRSAIGEEYIKNTNHSNNTPTSIPPVEQAPIRKNEVELKRVNVVCSFIANLFSKLVSFLRLRRRKNKHSTIDKNASTEQPASLTEPTEPALVNGNITWAEAEASGDMHDRPESINTTPFVSPAACHIASTDLSISETLQSGAVATTPSKVKDRHIGYVYFDYDGVGVDKGKAVVVGSDNSENPVHLTGLIVVPQAAGITGEFRRVGIFHINGRFDDDDETPYCDTKSWLDSPTEVITII